jgi:glycerol-3-phosphate acyltransferase PlsX
VALITIAVDAMGGDAAPAAIVSGAVQAASCAPIRVVLVGASAALESELARHARRDLPISVAEAPEVVGMDEAPLAALRRKPAASIKVAAELVARGEAQALFSAGHTGATLLAAHAAFGVMPAVERPALAVTVPTRAGAAILLDAGANVECRPTHLVQFGLMGAAYARIKLGVADPKVGLLSIGEEAMKGNDLVRDAHTGLAAAPLSFVGNIGAQELFSGRADVVVCDGFTGNIALKVGEGVVEAVEIMLREEFSGRWLARVGALLSRPAFRRFRRRVDYAEYGGAPLLGVGKVTIVAHGRSSPRAVCSGIRLAARLTTERVVERLHDALERRAHAAPRT